MLKPFVMVAAVAGLLGCGLFWAFAQDDDTPKRPVYVRLAPDVTVEAAQTSLKAVGFTSTGSPQHVHQQRFLVGQLSEKALTAAAALAAVAELHVGSPAGQVLPPVTDYSVRVRYRIDADRQERFRQYNLMLKRLENVGFKKLGAVEGDWYFTDLLNGEIPAAGAGKFMEIPQIRTVILTPKPFPDPAEPTKPVLVELLLHSSTGQLRGGEIANHVRGRLRKFNFREAVGYDRRAQSRLLGWLPWNRVAELLDEAHWMALATGDTTRSNPRLAPIRRVEVLRDDPALGPPPAPELPPAPEADELHLHKLQSDLRSLLAGLPEDQQLRPIRVEVVTKFTNDPDSRTVQDALADLATSFRLDGRIGPLATGYVTPHDVPSLARTPVVSSVRLPRLALAPQLPPPGKGDGVRDRFIFAPLNRTVTAGAADFTTLVRRRGEQKVAVVADDFRGAGALAGDKLPKRTVVLDFTPSTNKSLTPDPEREPADELGVGTRLAMALHEAVPIDELYLVRLNAASPFQVQNVVDKLEGGTWQSEALVQRDRDLSSEFFKLRQELAELRLDRAVVAKRFREDEEYRTIRDALLKRQAAYDAAQQTAGTALAKLLDQYRMADRLGAVGTVAIGLHWQDGHPDLVEGLAGLRYLRRPTGRNMVWLQAIPRTPDQAWRGAFRDADGDGIMEFADDTVKRDGFASVRPLTAAADLNFLGWRPHNWLTPEAAAVPVVAPKLTYQELPPNAVVQLTVQWREAHDPAWKGEGQKDHYRPSLANLSLHVLRVRDGAASGIPEDAFEPVALSNGYPDRLEDHPRYAIYQSTVRFQVPERAGRYAVQIRGKEPVSVLPSSAPLTPNAPRSELSLTLRIETIGPAARRQGTAVLETFRSE